MYVSYNLSGPWWTSPDRVVTRLNSKPDGVSSSQELPSSYLSIIYHLSTFSTVGWTLVAEQDRTALTIPHMNRAPSGLL